MPQQVILIQNFDECNLYLSVKHYTIHIIRFHYELLNVIILRGFFFEIQTIVSSFYLRGTLMFKSLAHHLISGI